MTRCDHYAEAEKLIHEIAGGDTAPTHLDIPDLLAALTHAVLATVDHTVEIRSDMRQAENG
jgi:hypothetical protein